jgi:hypothetical protein
MAANMSMTVSWDAALLKETVRRFRGAYCIQHRTPWYMANGTSKTRVSFYGSNRWTSHKAVVLRYLFNRTSGFHGGRSKIFCLFGGRGSDAYTKGWEFWRFDRICKYSSHTLFRERMVLYIQETLPKCQKTFSVLKLRGVRLPPPQ